MAGLTGRDGTRAPLPGSASARRGPYLSDHAQNAPDPVGGVEAARAGAYGCQHASHEVEVMDGLGPYGAAELWSHRRGVSRRPLGPGTPPPDAATPYLVSLPTVPTLGSHWGAAGCGELDPAGARVITGWGGDDTGGLSHLPPSSLCLPPTGGCRCSAKALQVEGTAAHALEHQRLLAAGRGAAVSSGGAASPFPLSSPPGQGPVHS